MRPIRCLLGFHKFSEWIEVENHLERECLRSSCGEVEVKYPDPLTSIARIASSLIWKYYMWNTSPKTLVPPNKPALKRTDNR